MSDASLSMIDFDDDVNDLDAGSDPQAEAAGSPRVRKGEILSNYDAMREYLEGRDLVTEFIRALRDRNSSFAQMYHLASTERARDRANATYRAEELVRHSDDFAEHVRRHADAMTGIVRTITELMWNGHPALSSRLNSDLEDAQREHRNHP